MASDTPKYQIIYSNKLPQDMPMGDIKIIDKTHGTIEWVKDRVLHRTNGPARIWHDGCEEWCVKGDYHREDGPAYVDPTEETESWYIRDRPVTSFRQLQRMLKCSDEHIVAMILRWGPMQNE